MNHQFIYFDYNATTPVLNEVLKAMEPYFCEDFGNPSSMSHPYGWSAKIAVDESRQIIAKSIGAKNSEIFFTSGATESNNLAILGFAMSELGKNSHFITSSIEHKAVLEVAQLAEKKFQIELDVINPDQFGMIHLDEIKKHVKKNTKFISIMMANNEIGTINPIKEIGLWCKDNGIIFHTDCAQSYGKVAIDVEEMGIDLLSISGHKIYGPKGIGAIYVRSSNPTVELSPPFTGGLQENGLRPGTLNVPGIVGLGEACKIALNDMNEENLRLSKLRDLLIKGITSNFEETQLNGHPSERLANNVSISIHGLSSDLFALGLSGLALSSGSACTSASGKASHVLKAIGLSDELARSTLRFGLGRKTTAEHIDIAIEKVTNMIKNNRKSY